MCLKCKGYIKTHLFTEIADSKYFKKNRNFILTASQKHPPIPLKSQGKKFSPTPVLYCLYKTLKEHNGNLTACRAISLHLSAHMPHQAFHFLTQCH